MLNEVETIWNLIIWTEMKHVRNNEWLVNVKFVIRWLMVWSDVVISSRVKIFLSNHILIASDFLWIWSGLGKLKPAQFWLKERFALAENMDVVDWSKIIKLKLFVSITTAVFGELRVYYKELFFKVQTTVHFIGLS